MDDQLEHFFFFKVNETGAITGNFLCLYNIYISVINVIAQIYIYIDERKVTFMGKM